MNNYLLYYTFKYIINFQDSLLKTNKLEKKIIQNLCKIFSSSPNGTFLECLFMKVLVYLSILLEKKILKISTFF